MAEGGSISPDEYLRKAERYCAYQDRSEKEVRLRLMKWSCPASKIDAIIESLQESGFVDDHRFAESYTRGKFKMKKWGRKKIRSGLLSKGIANQLIENALDDISEDEYNKTVDQLLSKYTQRNVPTNKWQFREKIIRYLSGKGYETGIVIEAIERFDSNNH